MPDLAKLYSSLNTAWDKVRVDVLSHSFLLAVFFLAGITPPRVTFPVVDVNEVMNHSIYKLAKDTNALLLVPVASVVGSNRVWPSDADARPGAGERDHRDVSPDRRRSVHRRRCPCAGSRNDRFASEAKRFQRTRSIQRGVQCDAAIPDKQDKDMQQFQVGQQNKDASLYLGYAILFPICWFALFLWLPSESTWKMQNSRAFWPVLSLLLLFLLRSWIRVREFLLMLPGSLVSFMAYKIRTDLDLAAALDAAKPRLADIEARVESIASKRFAKRRHRRCSVSSTHDSVALTPRTRSRRARLGSGCGGCMTRAAAFQ